MFCESLRRVPSPFEILFWPLLLCTRWTSAVVFRVGLFDFGWCLVCGSSLPPHVVPCCLARSPTVVQQFASTPSQTSPEKWSPWRGVLPVDVGMCDLKEDTLGSLALATGLYLLLRDVENIAIISSNPNS